MLQIIQTLEANSRQFNTLLSLPKDRVSLPRISTQMPTIMDFSFYKGAAGNGPKTGYEHSYF